MTLEETLGSRAWLEENEDKLKSLLPETWTHVLNFNMQAFGFGLKLLGVDWGDQRQLHGILRFLERGGFMLRDGVTLRRSNRNVFARAR